MGRKITPRRYIKRELLGVLMGPFVFALVASLLYPLLKQLGIDFDLKIYLLYAFFGIIASLITYIVTYKIIFGRGRIF